MQWSQSVRILILIPILGFFYLRDGQCNDQKAIPPRADLIVDKNNSNTDLKVALLNALSQHRDLTGEEIQVRLEADPCSALAPGHSLLGEWKTQFGINSKGRILIQVCNPPREIRVFVNTALSPMIQMDRIHFWQSQFKKEMRQSAKNEKLGAALANVLMGILTDLESPLVTNGKIDQVLSPLFETENRPETNGGVGPLGNFFLWLVFALGLLSIGIVSIALLSPDREISVMGEKLISPLEWVRCGWFKRKKQTAPIELAHGKW